MNPKQKQDIKELLWDYLSKDKEHKDRRQTGWGTKTEEGLIACIENIMEEKVLV